MKSLNAVSTRTVKMKPPKYAKSVTVQAPETGVNSIKVTAVYKGNQVKDESITVTLTEDGQSHTFPEKTEDMGTWFAVMPIHIIKGEIGENEFQASPGDYCDGVEAHLKFTLHHQPDHIRLAQ